MSQSVTDASVSTPLDMRLRRHLADQRRSGRWLADQTGLSRATMARVLAGQRDLTLTEAGAVARALGIHAAQLLDSPMSGAAATPVAS